MEQHLQNNEIRQKYDVVLRQIKEHCGKINRNPNEIRLIAVSKTQPPSTVVAALEGGINTLGENYAQEFQAKAAQVQSELPTGVTPPEWHFIGHLQRNKVKMIMPYVHWIHSVDSVKLTKEISKQAVAHQKTVNILIQVHTSGEATKFGCQPEEVHSIVADALTMQGVIVRGLMTIGTLTDDPELVRPMFRLLRTLRNELRLQFERFSYFGTKPILEELSMGMSNDFRIALEEGATMVRIGTSIFGARQ